MKRTLSAAFATLCIMACTGAALHAGDSPSVSHGSVPRSEVNVVVGGKTQAATRVTGLPWETSHDGLTAEGTGRFLHANPLLGSGDFRIKARLKLARLDGSAASFEIAGGRFGFDGRGGTFFTEGGWFAEGGKLTAKPADFITPGKPFEFEVVRERSTTRFLIDRHEVHRLEGWTEPAGRVGFRPWRNRMEIGSFSIEGTLTESPVPPPPLFSAGNDGYHTYRIPALAVTKKGTVLAFCEGRKNSAGDSGDIDLLVKRSTDNGKTWNKQQTVWDDGPNCCGNPCVVADKETGTIWLLACWNRGDDHEGAIIAQKSKDMRRVFAIRSDDDGLTWSKPEEITKDVKKANWTWYATGPGNGIQIEHGNHKGRLVIPCDHIEAGTKRYFSHVIYSDDHGRTWKLGGSTPKDKVNECAVVELTGGRLMLNMRNYDRSQHARQSALSDDGGITWKDQKHEPSLIEPICQAAILRHRWPQGEKPGMIVFSNPASTGGRVKLTVRASFDDGVTWPVSKLLFDGPGGYSDLATLANGRIACFYEGGEQDTAQSIIFQIVEPLETKP